MKPRPFPEVAIVGMHFRGAEVKALVSNFIPPLTLQLEREPDNRFDAFAIKAMYEGTHVGYIEAGQAAFISPWMDQGHAFEARVERMEQRRNNLHPICTVAPVEE